MTTIVSPTIVNSNDAAALGAGSCPPFILPNKLIDTNMARLFAGTVYVALNARANRGRAGAGLLPALLSLVWPFG